MDETSFESHVQISLNIFKCIGLLPWKNNVKGWKRVICMIQYYLLVCIALQLFYKLIIQISEIGTVFNELDSIINLGNLIFLNITLLPRIKRRFKLISFLQMKPSVVSNKIVNLLKQAKLKALALYILTIALYIFISWLMLKPLSIDKIKNLLQLSDMDMNNDLLTNTIQIIQWVWDKYVTIVLSLLSMGTSLLIITTLILMNCYLDHLIESVKVARIRPLHFIRRNLFMSEHNREVIDINYIVSVHQYIVKLVHKFNKGMSFGITINLMLNICKSFILLIIVFRKMVKENDADVVSSFFDIIRSSLIHFLMEVIIVFINIKKIKAKSILLHKALTKRVNTCGYLADGTPHPERINFKVMEAMAKLQLEISSYKYFNLFLTSWQSRLFFMTNFFLYYRAITKPENSPGEDDADSADNFYESWEDIEWGW